MSILSFLGSTKQVHINMSTRLFRFSRKTLHGNDYLMTLKYTDPTFLLFRCFFVEIFRRRTSERRNDDDDVVVVVVKHL